MEAELKQIASKVIESEVHCNGIVDLLKYLQEDNELIIIRTAIDGLYDIFCHYLWEHYEWFYPGLYNSNVDPVTVEFGLWIKGKYKLTLQKLIEFLNHSELQIHVIDVLMKLLKWEGKCHQETTPQNAYNFSNCLYMQILQGIVTCDSSDLISHFIENYMNYQDIKYFTLQNLITVINKVLENPKLPVYLRLINNLHNIIQQIAITTDHYTYYAGNPTNSKRQQVSNVTSPQKLKNVFTNFWLAFLQLKLPSLIHKKVLVSLHRTVMPHINKPHLLVDFLVGSYDKGGVYSILALNGLFILMHHYHLDYPNFYQNLYSLLHPSIYYVKYMARFFKLLDIFLSSTHLPLYLIAAFIKKLSRLALSAPPIGAMVTSVFVMNLIKRHPNCKVLLHRPTSTVFEIESDPFLMEQTDPMKCNALESCLWELKTLKDHYHPMVASLVVKILDPEWQCNSEEESLQQYLDLKTFKIIEKESVEGTSEVAINYTSPLNLWKGWI